MLCGTALLLLYPPSFLLAAAEDDIILTAVAMAPAGSFNSVAVSEPDNLLKVTVCMR
jgi:hypothetical protein